MKSFAQSKQFNFFYTLLVGVILTLTEDSRVSKHCRLHSYKRSFTGSGDVTALRAFLFHAVSNF